MFEKKCFEIKENVGKDIKSYYDVIFKFRKKCPRLAVQLGDL